MPDLISLTPENVDKELSDLPRMVRLAFGFGSKLRRGTLDVTLPDDGDYLVRLSKFTYTAGGPDYFYRLSIASAPYIDAVFPPMIEPGKTASGKATIPGSARGQHFWSIFLWVCAGDEHKQHQQGGCIAIHKLLSWVLPKIEN